VLIRPASGCYWAILEAPGVPLSRGRRTSPSVALALDQLFENELPVPIDSVHAVYRRIDQRRVLAVAIPIDELGAVPAGVNEVSPATVPECLSIDERIDPRELNLLTGPYEPPALGRERSARLNSTLLGMVLVCGLIAWGFSRHESAFAIAAAKTEAGHAELARRLMPDRSVPLAKVQQRVNAELEELRRVTAAGRGGHAQFDAADTLEGLLRGWPAEAASVRTDLVSITPTAAALTVGLEGDAQAFVARLGAPEGWALEPPQLSVTRTGTQLSLQFKPVSRRGGAVP